MASLEERPVDHDDSWLWPTLWNGCASGLVRAKVYVIETVLFTQGVPTRWLYTSANGYLVARRFSDEPSRPSGSSADAMSATLPPVNITQQSVMARLSETLHSFILFITNFSGSAPDPGSPIVSVTYVDGRMEVLRASDYASMSSYPQWLSSIARIQPCLPLHELRTGVYSRRTLRAASRILRATAFLGKQRQSLLDKLTREGRSLAIQAAGASAAGTGAAGTGRDQAAEDIASLGPDTPVTPEDRYTLNLARLIHGMHQVQLPGALAPPQLVGELQTSAHASRITLAGAPSSRPKGTKGEKQSKDAAVAAAASQAVGRARLQARRASIEGGLLPPDSAVTTTAGAGAAEGEDRDVALSSDSDDERNAAQLSPPSRTLRVIALCAHYAVDISGRAWLSGLGLACTQSITPQPTAYYTVHRRRAKTAADKEAEKMREDAEAAVNAKGFSGGPAGELRRESERVPRAGEMRVLKPEDAHILAWQEAREAAVHAHARLLELIDLGKEKGLKLEEIWGHFDTQGAGFNAISEATFRERLAALDIRLHDAAWSLLCNRIKWSAAKGKGGGLLTKSAFKEFLTTDPYGEYPGSSMPPPVPLEDAGGELLSPRSAKGVSAGKKGAARTAGSIGMGSLSSPMASPTAPGSPSALASGPGGYGTGSSDSEGPPASLAAGGRSTRDGTRAGSRQQTAGASSMGAWSVGAGTLPPGTAPRAADSAGAACGRLGKGAGGSPGEESKGKGRSSDDAFDDAMAAYAALTRRLGGGGGESAKFGVLARETREAKMASQAEHARVAAELAAKELAERPDWNVSANTASITVGDGGGKEDTAASPLVLPVDQQATLSSIAPDAGVYHVKPSGQLYDIAPSKARPLAPDARPNMVRELRGILEAEAKADLLNNEAASAAERGGAVGKAQVARLEAELAKLPRTHTGFVTSALQIAIAEEAAKTGKPGSIPLGALTGSNELPQRMGRLPPGLRDGGGGPISGSEAYTLSAKPSGFQAAWRKEREKHAVKEQERLKREVEAAKRREREKKAIARAKLAVKAKGSRRRRLQQAYENMEEKSGYESSDGERGASSPSARGRSTTRSEGSRGSASIPRALRSGLPRGGHTSGSDSSPSPSRSPSPSGRPRTGTGSDGEEAYLQFMIRKARRDASPGSSTRRSVSHAGAHVEELMPDTQHNAQTPFGYSAPPAFGQLDDGSLTTKIMHQAAAGGVPIPPALLSSGRHQWGGSTVPGAEPSSEQRIEAARRAVAAATKADPKLLQDPSFKQGVLTPGLVMSALMDRRVTRQEEIQRERARFSFARPHQSIADVRRKIRLATDPMAQLQHLLAGRLQAEGGAKPTARPDELGEGPVPPSRGAAARARVRRLQRLRLGIKEGSPDEVVGEVTVLYTRPQEYCVSANAEGEETSCLFQVLAGYPGMQTAWGVVRAPAAVAATQPPAGVSTASWEAHAAEISRRAAAEGGLERLGSSWDANAVAESTMHQFYPFSTGSLGPGCSPYVSGRPCDILYIPDWWEDIDGLTDTLRPLVTHAPASRLLIYQPPGWPGAACKPIDTKYSKLPRPSPDLAALVLLKLVRYLRETGVWGPVCVQDARDDLLASARAAGKGSTNHSGPSSGPNSVYRDVVVIGSGYGAHVASIFITQFVSFAPHVGAPRYSLLGGPDSRDWILMSAVRALVCLNGYAFVDKELRPSYERLQRLYTSLAELPAVLTPHEKEEVAYNRRREQARQEAMRKRLEASRSITLSTVQKSVTLSTASGGGVDAPVSLEKTHEGHTDEDGPFGGLWAHPGTGIPGTVRASPRPEWREEDGDRGSLLAALELDVYGPGAKPFPAQLIRAESNSALSTMLFSNAYLRTYGDKAVLFALHTGNSQLSEGDTAIDRTMAAMCAGAARGMDVRSELRNLPLPVLLLVGTSDTFVTPTHSYDLASIRSQRGGSESGMPNGPDSGGSTLGEWLSVAALPPMPEVLMEYAGEGPEVPPRPEATDSSAAVTEANHTAGDKVKMARLQSVLSQEALAFYQSAKMIPRPVEQEQACAVLPATPNAAREAREKAEAVRLLTAPLAERIAAERVREQNKRNTRPTHVTWLQCGHAMLVERREYVLRTLASVVLGSSVAGINNTQALTPFQIALQEEEARARAKEERKKQIAELTKRLGYTEPLPTREEMEAAAAAAAPAEPDPHPIQALVQLGATGRGGTWAVTSGPAGPTFSVPGQTGPAGGQWELSSANSAGPWNAQDSAAGSPYMSSPAGSIAPGLFDGQALQAAGYASGGSGATMMVPLAGGQYSIQATTGAEQAKGPAGTRAEWAQVKQGREAVVEELRKRGIEKKYLDKMDELAALTKLEQLLEKEREEAVTAEERLSDSKTVRLRKLAKFNAELAEKQRIYREEQEAKRVREELIRNAMKGPVKRYDLLPPPDPKDLERERQAMIEDDNLAHAVEESYLIDAKRAIDAEEVHNLMSILTAVLRPNEAQHIKVAVLTALGLDGLENISKTPQGLNALVGLGIPPEVLALSKDAIASTLEQRRKRLQTKGQDVTKDVRDADLQAKEAFITGLVDLKRARAARVALLRTKATIIAAKLPGERLGYGLDLARDGSGLAVAQELSGKNAPQASLVASGAQRLIFHCTELRVKRKAALRRWRRSDHRARVLEADLLRMKSRLGNLHRSVVFAKREFESLGVIAKRGDRDSAKVLSSGALKAAQGEVNELADQIKEYELSIRAINGQRELVLVELAGLSASLAFITRRSDEKEALLRSMRVVLSRMLSERKQLRKDAKGAQENALTTVSAALADLSARQARLKDLKAEKLRVRHIKTQHVDTAVWNPGQIQRIRTEEFRAWLDEQVLKCKIQVSDAIAAVEALRTAADAAEVLYARTSDDGRVLSRALESVVDCVRNSPSVTNPLETDMRKGGLAVPSAADLARADASRYGGASRPMAVTVEEDEDDGVDEDAEEEGAGEGEGEEPSGTTTSHRRRAAAASDMPGTRRDASIAWRQGQLARRAEENAYLEELLGSRDPSILADVGALLEPASGQPALVDGAPSAMPGTDGAPMQKLTWVTDWHSRLTEAAAAAAVREAEAFEALLASPTAGGGAGGFGGGGTTATATATATAGGRSRRASLGRGSISSPTGGLTMEADALNMLAQGLASPTTEGGAAQGGLAGLGRDDVLRKVVVPGAGGALMKPLRLGYASPEALSHGLAMVIGHPASAQTAAAPIIHHDDVYGAEMNAVIAATTPAYASPRKASVAGGGGGGGRTPVAAGARTPVARSGFDTPDAADPLSPHILRPGAVPLSLPERSKYVGDEGRAQRRASGVFLDGPLSPSSRVVSPRDTPHGTPPWTGVQHELSAGTGAAPAPGQPGSQHAAWTDLDLGEEAEGKDAAGESKEAEGASSAFTRPTLDVGMNSRPRLSTAAVPGARDTGSGSAAAAPHLFPLPAAGRSEGQWRESAGSEAPDGFHRPTLAIPAKINTKGGSGGGRKGGAADTPESTGTGGSASPRRKFPAGAIPAALSNVRVPLTARFIDPFSPLAAFAPGMVAGRGYTMAGLKTPVGRLSLGEQMAASGLRLVPDCRTAVVIRYRPAVDRTPAMKRWIALDRRMHPKLYSRVPADDAETYAGDPLYKTMVPKQTLFKIAALPCSPLQALAFLRNPQEVALHSTLVRYLHGQGQDAERLRDQEVGARAVAAACVARGYVARTKNPEDRSQEEMDWVSLDRLLRPHLYIGEPSPLEAEGGPTILREYAGDNELAAAAEARGRPLAGMAAPSRRNAGTAAGGVAGSGPATASGTLINKGDENLGLNTYDANLSAEGVRRSEGAFGSAVRKVFRKLFRYDQKQEDKASTALAEAQKKRYKKAARAGKNKGISFPEGLASPGEERERDGKSAGAAGAGGGAPDTRRSSRRGSTARSSRGGDGDSDWDTGDEGASGDEAEDAPRIPGAKGVQYQGSRVRPAGGTIGIMYTREDLTKLLCARSTDLAGRPMDLRAQLLLRMYGSDGGEWAYKTALSYVTPVVTGIGEIGEAADQVRSDMRKRGDVDYGAELVMAYPDGDDTNSAAVAASSINGTVLVRANHSLQLMSLHDSPLRPGVTVDHFFEVPGSLFDVVGYGARPAPEHTPGAPYVPGVQPLPQSDPSLQPRPTSGCLGLGLPPSWQGSAADVDLLVVSHAEAIARGILPETFGMDEQGRGKGRRGKSPSRDGGSVKSGGGRDTARSGADTERSTASKRARGADGAPLDSARSRGSYSAPKTARGARLGTRTGSRDLPDPQAAAGRMPPMSARSDASTATSATMGAIRAAAAAEAAAAAKAKEAEWAHMTPTERVLAASVPDIRKLDTQSERETGVPGARPVAIDLTITIAFHGTFVDRSYVLGKLTAGVYRESFVPPGAGPVPVHSTAAAETARISKAQAATTGGPAVPSVTIGPDGAPVLERVADVPIDFTSAIGGGAVQATAAPSAGPGSIPLDPYQWYVPIPGFSGHNSHITIPGRHGLSEGGGYPGAGHTSGTAHSGKGGDYGWGKVLPSGTSGLQDPFPMPGGRRRGGAGGLSSIPEEGDGSGVYSEGEGGGTGAPGTAGTTGTSYLHFQRPRAVWGASAGASPEPRGGAAAEPFDLPPWLPFKMGRHDLPPLMGPKGVPPIRPCAPVRRALAHPNDVDPSALARAINRAGSDVAPILGYDSWQGWPVYGDDQEGPRGRAAQKAAREKMARDVKRGVFTGSDSRPSSAATLDVHGRHGGTSPSRGGAGSVAGTVSTTKGRGMQVAGARLYDAEGADSDPETYLARDVLYIGRLYTRHKRHTTVIREKALQSVEDRLALRRAPGWYFSQAQAAQDAIAASAAADAEIAAEAGGGESAVAQGEGAEGGMAATIAGVDTRVRIKANSTIKLRPDTLTLASKRSRKGKLAKDIPGYGEEESLGLDMLATATMAGAPSFGTLRPEASFASRTDGGLAAPQETVFPRWREERDKAYDKAKEQAVVVTHKKDPAAVEAIYAEKTKTFRVREALTTRKGRAEARSQSREGRRRAASADAVNLHIRPERGHLYESPASPARRGGGATAGSGTQGGAAQGAKLASLTARSNFFTGSGTPGARTGAGSPSHTPKAGGGGGGATSPWGKSGGWGLVGMPTPDAASKQQRSRARPGSGNSSHWSGLRGEPEPVKRTQFPGDLGQRRVKVSHPNRPQTYHPSQAPPLAREPLTSLLPNIPQDQVAATARYPIGYAMTSECAPNTVKTFGVLKVRHEPMHAPVLPGRYVVSITGLSPGSYSISVVATCAYPAHVVVEGAIRANAASTAKIASARADVADISLSQRLGARKRGLVGHLIHVADRSINNLQTGMASLRAGLSSGHILRGDLGSDDDIDFGKSETLIDTGGRDVAGIDPDDIPSDSGDDTSSDDEVTKSIKDTQRAIEMKEKLRARKEKLDRDPAARAAAALEEARRKRTRLEVTSDIGNKVKARLQKLEKAFTSVVRQLHTRRREYADIQDGLSALTEARIRREADLIALLQQNREYNRHLPGAIRSLLCLSVYGAHVYNHGATMPDDIFKGSLGDHWSEVVQQTKLPAPSMEISLALGRPTRGIGAHGGTTPAPMVGTLRRVSVLAAMGFTDINELLSLGGTSSWGPNGAPPSPAPGRPMLSPGRRGSVTSPFGIVSPTQFLAQTGGTALPRMPMIKGAQEGAMLALVKGAGTAKTIKYRYGYPVPGPEEVAYARVGPFPLLWNRKAALETAQGKGALPTATPAQLIRRKRLSELTEEEKLWMAYDRVLNPDKYERRGGGGGVGGAAEEDSEDEEEEEEEYEAAQAAKKKDGSPGKAGTGGGSPGKAAVGSPAGPSALNLGLVAAPTGGDALALVPAGSTAKEAAAARKRKRESDDHTSLEDGVAVRFDLDAPPLAIYRALYLSAEDKAGLRGNRRDVGPQTTSIMVTEGTLLMSQLAKRKADEAAAIARAMKGLTVGDSDEDDDDEEMADLAGTGLTRGIVMGLPSLEGGLGWSRSREQAALAVKELSVAMLEKDPLAGGGEGGRKAKKTTLYSSKLDRILPKPQTSAEELSRVLSVPVSQLTPKERDIRKMFARFHDNVVPPKVRQAMATAGLAASKHANQAGKVIGTGMGGGGLTAELVYDKVTGAMVYKTDEMGAADMVTLNQKASQYTSMQRFQAVGSAFAVARSAVPIPTNAPIHLRRVLNQRAERLQTMWEENHKKMGHSQAVGTKEGGSITPDIDARARELLTELDRANACERPTIDSAVLHGDEQRFATPVLRDCLEMELDRVLLAQVYEREAIERALMSEATSALAEHAAQKAAEEAFALRKRREESLLRMAQEEEKRKKALEQEAIAAGKKILLTAAEIEDRARRAAVAATLESEGAASTLAKSGKLGQWKGTGFKAAEGDDPDLAETMGSNTQKYAGRDGGEKLTADEEAMLRGGDFNLDELDPLLELGGLALWGDPDKPLTPRRAAQLKAEMLVERAKKRESEQKDKKTGTDAITGRLQTIFQRRREERRAGRGPTSKVNEQDQVLMDGAKFAGNAGEGEEAGEGDEHVDLLGAPKKAVPDDFGNLPVLTCLSCMTVPCNWKPHLDVTLVQERKEEVEKEMFRVRHIDDPATDALMMAQALAEPGQQVPMPLNPATGLPWEPIMIKCDRALSYLRGGPVRQTKTDLIFELAYELAALRSMSRLAELDSELHAVHASRDASVTTTALHGYPQQTYRTNAIIQLEAESNRIIARQLAQELVDDILEWMLEGWYFGEARSKQIVAGYVGSLNKDRPLRPFEARSAAAALYSEQGPAARARAADAARGLLPAVGGNAGGNAAAVHTLSRFAVGVKGLYGSLLDPAAAGAAAQTAENAAKAAAAAWALGEGQGAASAHATMQSTVVSLLMTSMMPGAPALSAAAGMAHSAAPPTAPGLDVPGATAALPMAMASEATVGQQFVAGITTYGAGGTGAHSNAVGHGGAGLRSSKAETEVIELNTVGVAKDNAGMLPTGFYRIDDPLATARMRAEIAAQDMLHSFLIHGGKALGQVAMAAPAAVTGVFGGAAGTGSSGAFQSTVASLDLTAPTSSGARAVVPFANVPGVTAGDADMLAGTVNPSVTAGLTGALVRAGAMATQGRVRSTAALAMAMAALPPEVLGAGQRTRPEDRARATGHEVAARAAIRKAVQTTADVLTTLDLTENTLRYGMFLLALTYFRIMNQLARLRSMMEGGSEGVASATGASGPLGASASTAVTVGDIGMAAATRKAMTAERARMVAAEKMNFMRETAKAMTNAKAAAGFAKRAARAAAAAEAERQARARRYRRAHRDNAAAINIQRIFRGYRVRKSIDEYRRRKKAHDEYQLLRQYAATRIQAVWRSWMARQVVAARRKELTEFMRFVRANDAEEMLSEYYKQNPLQRWKREILQANQKQEAVSAVATVRKARLLDDEEIEDRMRMAGGSLARDKDVMAAGGSRRAPVVGGAAAKGASKRAVGASARGLKGNAAAEDDPDVERPIDLDALGTDEKYFGIDQRVAGEGYRPIGKARLRQLESKKYYSSSSAALQAEARFLAAQEAAGTGLGVPGVENVSSAVNLQALGLGTGVQYAAPTAAEKPRDAVSGFKLQHAAVARSGSGAGSAGGGGDGSGSYLNDNKIHMGISRAEANLAKKEQQSMKKGVSFRLPPGAKK